MVIGYVFAQSYIMGATKERLSVAKLWENGKKEKNNNSQE